MKWLKRIFKWVAPCLLVLLLGAIGWVHYYLNSPRVSEKIRRIVAERFWARLEFEQARINLFTGLKIKNARLYQDSVSQQPFWNTPHSACFVTPLK
jgi:hypothetical protein